MTVLRPALYGDSERNFRVFEASAAWGKGQERFGAVRGWGKVAEAAIPLCIRAKVIIYPTPPFLLQEWNLDPEWHGQNEPIMGNQGSKTSVLRLSCYGDSERNFRVFEAILLWVKTEDRTAGKQRERDRVRERGD